jgi:hypothetical protein
MAGTIERTGDNVMVNLTEVIDRYVAVWNESNMDQRRRRIRSAWAPDGTTCYRLLDACGYDAIEGRVTGSWDKWLREGKHIFRPRHTACHHDVVKFDFVMVRVPDGEVEADGLSFLVLDPDGCIAHDYQFNPAANDADQLAERYVAVLNEPDPDVRRGRIAELWASDGAFISETSVRNGRAAIEVEAAQVHDAYVAKGFVFSSGRSQAHHSVARLTWRMRAKDGEDAAATGSDLLILDDDGRIRFDYRFDD